MAQEYNNENKEQLSIEKENIKIELVEKEKQIEVEKNNDPKKEKVNNVNYQEGKNAHEFSFINNNNISQLNNNNNSSGNKSNSLINLLNYSEIHWMVVIRKQQKLTTMIYKMIIQ